MSSTGASNMLLANVIRAAALSIFFQVIFCSFILADVTLPRLISDGMVLQRETALKIWGWASRDEYIRVDFAGKTYDAVADADGKWHVLLPPLDAGGPYTMTITGDNEVTVNDVLVGDVWFCSGQSNMVHMLNIHDVTYATDIAEANYQEIRQFLVPTAADLLAPQNDFPSGSWTRAMGEDVRSFSAVAYFFAKKIYDTHRVPIGIINASVGGTPIEAWISEERLRVFPALNGTIQQNKDTAYVQSVNRAAAQAARRKSFIPSAGGWRNINVPGYWEDQGIRDLDGVVWYRKEVDIPAAMAGKPARVFLGRIVDEDVLTINGIEVGRTTYMYPQRRYKVPGGVLKAGKNSFLVKVTNHGGKGGFVPDKPYCIFAGQDTVDLKGTWQYKVGEVFDYHHATVPSINIQNQPAALFNGMVAPAIDYALKGVLWYQGESNVGQHVDYALRLPALIDDWRTKWGNEMLPFLYVQLPGFMEYNYLPSESSWAALRESQRKALAVPQTAMAVAIDLGEWNDIHPDRKKEVGERLALLARKLVYSEDLVASGPMYQSYQKDGHKVSLSFDHVGSGLVTRDGGALSEFAIAGPDRKFVWAKAEIRGDRVVVWSEKVGDPMYVRYAWADNPVNPNLNNKEGLPASPFEIQIN